MTTKQQELNDQLIEDMAKSKTTKPATKKTPAKPNPVRRKSSARKAPSTTEIPTLAKPPEPAISEGMLNAVRKRAEREGQSEFPSFIKLPALPKMEYCSVTERGEETIRLYSGFPAIAAKDFDTESEFFKKVVNVFRTNLKADDEDSHFRRLQAVKLRSQYPTKKLAIQLALEVSREVERLCGTEKLSGIYFVQDQTVQGLLIPRHFGNQVFIVGEDGILRYYDSIIGIDQPVVVHKDAVEALILGSLTASKHYIEMYTGYTSPDPEAADDTRFELPPGNFTASKRVTQERSRAIAVLKEFFKPAMAEGEFADYDSGSVKLCTPSSSIPEFVQESRLAKALDKAPHGLGIHFVLAINQHPLKYKTSKAAALFVEKNAALEHYFDQYKIKALIGWFEDTKTAFLIIRSDTANHVFVEKKKVSVIFGGDKFPVSEDSLEILLEKIFKSVS